MEKKAPIFLPICFITATIILILFNSVVKRIYQCSGSHKTFDCYNHEYRQPSIRCLQRLVSTKCGYADFTCNDELAVNCLAVPIHWPHHTGLNLALIYLINCSVYIFRACSNSKPQMCRVLAIYSNLWFQLILALILACEI